MNVKEYIVLDMVIHKELTSETLQPITQAEADKFHDDYIKLVESHGFATGGSCGLFSEQELELLGEELDELEVDECK